MTNTGTETASWILIRGASPGGVKVPAPYPFAEAYGFLYAYNGPLFECDQGAPTPLVDNGAENNALPLCVVKSPNETFMAFNFCLSPGQSYIMLEGRWVGGITPSNIALLQISYVDTEQWCVK